MGGIKLTPKKIRKKMKLAKTFDENIYIYIYIFFPRRGVFFLFFVLGLDSLEIIGGGSSQLVKFN